jgi:hypothetical protein
MKRNWFRNILRGLSLTSALFVFQACYGTDQDFRTDVLIDGQVKSSATGEPIRGIRVSVPDKNQYENTDIEGKFSFYTEIADSYFIKFEDTDSILNGTYISKDTLLTEIYNGVFLDILLEPK